jgi:hypothetical protein
MKKRDFLPFVFWNGLYCKRIGGVYPIWILESVTGARYKVHYFDVELAQFNHKDNKQ